MLDPLRVDARDDAVARPSWSSWRSREGIFGSELRTRTMWLEGDGRGLEGIEGIEGEGIEGELRPSCKR